jgi:hypothetical protein
MNNNEQKEKEEKRRLAEIKRVQQIYSTECDCDFNQWLQDILSWIEIYKEEDKKLLNASSDKKCLEKLIKKGNEFIEQLQIAHAKGIEIFSCCNQPFCEEYNELSHDLLACPECSKSKRSQKYDWEAQQDDIKKFISDIKIKESLMPVIGKGRPSKKITYRLIALLGTMYQELTGERVLFYWENYKEQYVGNFDVFVCDILGILQMFDPSLPEEISLYKMNPTTLSEYIKRFLYDIYPKWEHKNQ